MPEKDKKVLESIAAAISEMSEFDKGYFLGVIEATAKNRDEQRAAEVTA